VGQILVTGVAGFIGSCVAQQLVSDGYSVVGVDDFSQGKPENVPPGIEFIKGDLAHHTLCDQLPKDIIKILHLAGQSSGEISFDNPVEDLKKNVISTLNLIEWGIRHGCQRIIYASSMAVYGEQEDRPTSERAVCHPLSCYGVGKLAAEQYLRLYHHQLPFTSLRMFNVYGPGQDMDNLRQGMVSIFLKMALVDGKIHVKGGLDRYRDLIYIQDVVDTWRRAMEMKGTESFVVNVGTGVRTTVKDLLSEMQPFVPTMNWYCSGSTLGDQHGIYADPTEFIRLFGMPRFTSLRDGLEKFVAWARAAA